MFGRVLYLAEDDGDGTPGDGTTSHGMDWND
jgi:hypothetical protein